MAKRRALITGANGQDGSYLCELLLAEGYEVYGMIRRSSTFNRGRLAAVEDKIHLAYSDLTDSCALASLVAECRPDEVYNLAAMSDVRVSFDVPNYAASVTGLGALNLLDAVCRERPQARVYQAGSSEMFGTNPDVPCDERSEFRPASPYAAAKVFAHHVAENYRDAYGMFISTGILYNHESERRGTEFVTRKITKAVAAISRCQRNELQLGNLDAKRDWGYAPEYMRAAWLMMQRDEPKTYVVATGETHSVREFADAAFSVAGLDWRDYVRHDANLERPTEVPLLLGDSSLAAADLGWKPEIKFHGLVQLMTEHDLRCG